MRTLARAFLRGVAVVLPIVLTVYVVAWLVMLIEDAAGAPLQWALGDFYWRGMGLALGLLLILLIGLLTYAGLFRHALELISGLFERIPLIKSLYGGLRDLTDFVSRAHDHDQVSHVVLVRVQPELRLLGFVTREDFENLPGQFSGAGEARVAVYLPMSYQIGGFTVLVPRSSIEEVDMGVEDAMRFSITAGMSLKTGPGDVLGELFRKRTDEAAENTGRDGGEGADPPAGGAQGDRP